MKKNVTGLIKSKQGRTKEKKNYNINLFILFIIPFSVYFHSSYIFLFCFLFTSHLFILFFQQNTMYKI